MFKNPFSKKEETPVFSEKEDALNTAYNIEYQLGNNIGTYRDLEKDMSDLMEEAENVGNRPAAMQYANEVGQARIDREKKQQELVEVKGAIIKLKTQDPYQNKDFGSIIKYLDKMSEKLEQEKNTVKRNGYTNFKKSLNGFDQKRAEYNHVDGRRTGQGNTARLTHAGKSIYEGFLARKRAKESQASNIKAQNAAAQKNSQASA